MLQCTQICWQGLSLDTENQSLKWVCTSSRISEQGQLSLWIFHNELQQGALVETCDTYKLLKGI